MYIKIIILFEYLFRWEFRTADHDIKFGVECFEDTGIKTTPIETHRVNCHQSDEIGVLQCLSPCTCEQIIFNNPILFD